VARTRESAAVSVVRGLAVSPAAYRPHPLHAARRVWPETNCSIDVWVELLHALGLDPVPAGGCALSADFLGDQWTFLKYPPDDLWHLYGLAVEEIYIWRPLIDHIEEQLAAGRLLTVEADSWYLPDTRGTSYRTRHAKTTIIPNAADRETRYLQYFHGTGYWELSGDDFDGVLGLTGAAALPPYVEVIRLDGLRQTEDLFGRAVTVARSHTSRRAVGNPVTRLGARLGADLPWLAHQPLETFHDYAFGLIRQCGATAEIAGSCVAWLEERGAAALAGAADVFARVAQEAKSLQFQVARVTQGRDIRVQGTLDVMAETWAEAMARVVDFAAR
jgi:hypothetical protein